MRFFLVVFCVVCAHFALATPSGRRGRKLFNPPQFGTTPEDAVNILGGTDSRYDLSRGSTLPLVARPWGFNTYAPQTDDDPTWPGWWFHPSDRRYFGLRLTHQPSPWISDYGNFLLKAYIPSNPSDPSASGDGFTGYSPYDSIFAPYRFSTTLFSYGNSKGNLKLDFTPTRHGGMMQATFPPFVESETVNSHTGEDGQLRRISIVLPQTSDSIQVTSSPLDNSTMLSGYTTHNSGGVGGDAAAFKHSFVACLYTGSEGTEPLPLSAIKSVHVDRNVAWVDISPKDASSDVISVRLATSFISSDQALTTFTQELSPLTTTFSSILNDAKAEWNSVLSRVQVLAPIPDADHATNDGLYSVFYSCLYRASLFPRMLTEHTADGSAVHWSPYATTAETRVQSGILSTDSGFWDAWNSVYPLLTLVNRPVLGDVMTGWVSGFQEGGWLAKWASPGYRGSMIGTMGDVSLADAIVKQLPGFDVQQAYAAIRKDAFEVPPHGVDGVGRVCLESYLELGYVPRGAPMTTGGTCYEVVSRTLNYLQSDYAIAQAAATLGYTDDAQVLTLRSQNYSKLFDGHSGFFRSRDIVNKDFTTPFDAYGWGGDYTEAGPWQFRFYVPYDAEGLASLYRSAAGVDMCSALKDTLTSPGYFHLGGYSSVIHEQTEMRDHCNGQYAHNNQPAHHLLYMHFHDGYTSSCATQGRGYIKQTLREQYSADADMFAGDEDNGEMGAWFVLGALGLYERSPGSKNFEFGVPLFPHVKIDISDTPHSHYRLQTGKDQPVQSQKRVLEILAYGNKLESAEVRKISWNGQAVDADANGIDYALLKDGGKLEFFMV